MSAKTLAGGAEREYDGWCYRDHTAVVTPTPESEVEAFLAGQKMIDCVPLAARIPRRQCVVNRHKKLPICAACKGKPIDAVPAEMPAALPWRASHNAIPRQIRTHEELVAEFAEDRGGGGFDGGSRPENRAHGAAAPPCRAVPPVHADLP